MASTSETGHAVNMANFKKIIDRCVEFGTDYNPPNADIAIATMTAKWTSVDGLHSDYLAALEETKLPINEREILFDNLNKIVVRSVNLYESTKASSQAKKDAAGYKLKITGQKTKIKKLQDGTPDPNYVSKSQRSFTQRVNNFEKLVRFYETDANYAPNENTLKIASLETMLGNLKTANENVNQLVVRAIQKRIERDHGLYDVGTGIYDLSVACKKYVKSLYGAMSPEALSVVAFKLRRVMKLSAV